MDEFLVRVTGIEPARRKALDPKSSASASSATLAFFIPFQKAKKPYFKPFSSIFEKKNQYKIIKVLNNLLNRSSASSAYYRPKSSACQYRFTLYFFSSSHLIHKKIIFYQRTCKNLTTIYTKQDTLKV